MKFLSCFIKKIPFEIKYIIFLFFVSRVALTLIGILSRIILYLSPGYGFESYSGIIWLDIWGVWDAGWYLSIVENGYIIPSNFLHENNLAFFPLYPFLVKCGGIIAGNNYISGIIASNIFLLVACVFLYKLVRLDFDENTALRSVKYLLLFPTAFIFSGFFTESLFVLLVIACFYYARKQNWFLAGLTGFCLALTKFIGVFVIMPILYEYLANKNFMLAKTRKDILFLLLIPCGLFVYNIYNYYLTGNFWAFAQIIRLGWGRIIYHPLFTLADSLFVDNINLVFGGIFTLATILIILFFYKKIRVSYWIFALYSIFIPLTLSQVFQISSMPRYILIIFPLFILFARIGKHTYLDQAMTIFFALLQGFLMVFWTNGFDLIV